jgi:beta-galactosidase/beta-glucuronidase
VSPILYILHEDVDVKETIIDLSGTWRFALDTANVCIQQKWYGVDINDLIALPGTTDLNRKGFVNIDSTTHRLNRQYIYEGPAWYRKGVLMPQDFREKHIRLIIERTKSSMIWIDSTFVGDSRLLQSPPESDVTDYLEPGEHFITVRIDNN